MVAENTWPMSDHCFGEPFSEEMTSAMSCARDWRAPESRLMPSARSAGVILGHGPSSKARRAAATAASMSAGDASGTRPMTSSVWGETTSMTSVLAGFTHSLPMKSVSRSVIVSTTAS